MGVELGLCPRRPWGQFPLKDPPRVLSRFLGDLSQHKSFDLPPSGAFGWRSRVDLEKGVQGTRGEV